jgi:hypothetical protein
MHGFDPQHCKRKKKRERVVENTYISNLWSKIKIKAILLFMFDTTVFS